jgi:hypothetical protein
MPRAISKGCCGSTIVGRHPPRRQVPRRHQRELLAEPTSYATNRLHYSGITQNSSEGGEVFNSISTIGRFS